MFAICFCYDTNYITGNAPEGIHVISSSNTYETLVGEFGEKMKERKKDAAFEFGWENEYRLCILEYLENNTIKELKLVDHDDGFWNKQEHNFKQIQCQPDEDAQPRSEWV
tara:strand:- start:40 stop:369 length:330 start_codon:yes stop_codon:yes gene_type:complete